MLFGGDGNDVLDTDGNKAGASLLFGGAGDDVIYAAGNQLSDAIDGGTGHNTAYLDVPGPGGQISDWYINIQVVHATSGE